MSSYVKDSLIVPRDGEGPLFTVNENGDVTATLRGYAVIPVEEYRRLQNAANNMELIGIDAVATSEGIRWHLR